MLSLITNYFLSSLFSLLAEKYKSKNNHMAHHTNVFNKKVPIKMVNYFLREPKDGIFKNLQ